MALSTPILYDIQAFDATKEYIFEFQYTGDQAFKNKLVIRDNITNNVVYEEIQTTFQLQHILPADTLTNRIDAYNAKIQVYNVSDISSAESQAKLFYCNTTPVFWITNIQEDDVVSSSSFSFFLEYSQEQEVKLSGYQGFLYDSFNKLLYTTESKNNDDLYFSVSGLEDNGIYYIQAKGYTLNGYVVETELIKFTVNYLRPAAFSIVQAENQKNKGRIKITSNVQPIDGETNQIPSKFLLNTWIDLRQDGSYVKYKEGISILSDFTIGLIVNNLIKHKVFFIMSEDSNSSLPSQCKLTLLYGENDIYTSDGDFENRAYIMLSYYYNTDLKHVVFSNLFNPPYPYDEFKLYVKRKDGRFSVYVDYPETNDKFVLQPLDYVAETDDKYRVLEGYEGWDETYIWKG